jgi:hypothetical protein
VHPPNESNPTSNAFLRREVHFQIAPLPKESPSAMTGMRSAVCHRSGAAKVSALRQRHGAEPRQDRQARRSGVLGLLYVREDKARRHQGGRVAYWHRPTRFNDMRFWVGGAVTFSLTVSSDGRATRA